MGHAWPGNVRALRHAVERAIILSEGTMLEIDDFSLISATQDAGARVPSAAADTTNLGDLERETVARALKDHKRNISRTAAALGVTRASLYRRMQKYGL
jgi:transcriptional regulator of acetoin/glycerol metabolism